jgi:cation transport ATPase
MNDDLRRVPETIRLSRCTSALLWQNISLALGIKAVFFVLTLVGSAKCGWRCLPTWEPAFWLSPTACACSGLRLVTHNPG